ncbi:unnamed protein product [Rhizophagus irregularis]|nr:unnamed protein product [Rhizophagus irregularis]
MSTQETNGGSSSGVLLNTNKEKGKPGRKRGPVWIHFNDIDKFYESDQIDSTKQVLCDKAVAKFFVCCGVAFHLVSHPFFIDIVKSLCNGYEPPCSTTLSNTLMNNELTKITVDQQLTLDKESDLTLGFDGWTSP